MSKLEEYERKRDFRRTGEPKGSGTGGSKNGRTYAIQKHDASQLHFDLRLEVDGALKSWAVPKGPSLDPGDKRLARMVEDHPLDYADFEGTIPEDEYGGGTVMLWDRGEWEPVDDEHAGQAGLDQGEFKFRLRGERLRGNWVLVRFKSSGDKDNWLLIKERDDQADKETDVVRKYDTSVKTGRTLEAIARDEGDDPSIAGVELSHPDRVLYPDQGVTKRQLAEYYEAAADWVLPWLAGRPLTVLRCPRGRNEECFYQKHATKSVPDEVGGVEIEEKNGRKRRYIVIENLAGLVAMVQQGALEFHSWGSRADRVDRPDRLVFDVDPGKGVRWKRAIEAARELRDRLDALGLSAFAKLTGGKGVHVIAPIERRSTWDEVKDFTAALCDRMAKDAPDNYITRTDKEQRKGRVFLDYLRNTRGGTCVVAYSTRARPHGPVATPVGWDELSPSRPPDRYGVENIMQRLNRLKNDPWAGFQDARRALNRDMMRAVGAD